MIELNIDASKWIELEKRVARAGGKNSELALQRALNHTGRKAKTKMQRLLAQQTGLTIKTTRRALKTKNASSAAGGFEIYSRGGNVRLKFFKPRETRRGVKASPWNSPRVYAGTFMRGGQFPNRVALKSGSTVLKRKGSTRLPLMQQRSGLFIPKEMVTGQTEQGFYRTAQEELAKRMIHELGFILGKL